jgi:ABC-type multidrug transport system ATPase subunit
LRTYSAGMQARLSFAISTCIDPEILLLAEAVGAGDAAFLEKAKHRLDAVVAGAGILVVASRSEGLVWRLYTKAIPLDQGSVVATGQSTRCWIVTPSWRSPAREERTTAGRSPFRQPVSNPRNGLSAATSALNSPHMRAISRLVRSTKAAGIGSDTSLRSPLTKKASSRSFWSIGRVARPRRPFARKAARDLTTK